MRYLEVGGARLSVIGLGTWQFGSKEWGYGAGYAATETLALVQRALDLGVNLIDTAEIYATGNSERLIGAALGDRRDEAFLATKVWPVLPLASVVEQRGRASAARLGVDVLDLYQVHWPNPAVPIGQTMAGMRRVQDSPFLPPGAPARPRPPPGGPAGGGGGRRGAAGPGAPGGGAPPPHCGPPPRPRDCAPARRHRRRRRTGALRRPGPPPLRGG